MSDRKSKGRKAKRTRRAAGARTGLVRAWLVGGDAQDELVRKWQEVERRLSAKAHEPGVSPAEAERSALPEARAVHELMRRLRAWTPRLRALAATIVATQPVSPRDALARIELARRILRPLDFETHAFALLDGGTEYLRDYLERLDKLERRDFHVRGWSVSVGARRQAP